jgi:TM2 domain-containing membrane protein YozV
VSKNNVIVSGYVAAGIVLLAFLIPVVVFLLSMEAIGKVVDAIFTAY